MKQVKRLATKLVEGFKKFDYDTRLKKLGLTTREKRHIRGDLIKTFKIWTDREKISNQDLFHVRQRLGALFSVLHGRKIAFSRP